MANKNFKEKQAAQKQAADKQRKIDNDQVVKMKFKENKYYNDRLVPYFEAGKTYEIEGADKIQRWLKRGGEIVEGELKTPEVVQNPSVIVPNEHTIDKPFGSVEKEEEIKAEEAKLQSELTDLQNELEELEQEDEDK